MRNQKNSPAANGRSVDTTRSSSSLREYELFATNIDGDVVSLGTTVSFTQFGSERVAERRVANMTGVQRLARRLTKKSRTFVVERLTD